MKIEELRKQLETTDRIEYGGRCHDCNKDAKISIFRDEETGNIVIEGGAVYDPEIDGTKQIFVKCNKCFMVNQTLTDWRPIDVFSRVVGYIRPISGWNRGKQEEWKNRKEYKIQL